MLIIDAHLDLAWNALHNDRDVTRAAHDIRVQENGIQAPNRGLATVGVPDLRRGRVAVVVGTVFARCTGKPAADLDFHTPQHCHAAGRGQLEFYRALDEAGIVRMITTAASLAEHLARWRRQEAEVTAETPVPGLIVSIEGADPLTEEENRGLIGTTVEHTWNAIMEMRSLPRPKDYYLDEYSEQVARLIEREMVAAPGVTRIIREVKARGMPLGLASSSLRKWVDLKLQVTGLAGAFDAVIAGDEIQRGKPAPDIYLEMAKRLNMVPGECLAVEDSPSGVAAAVAAGMYTVAVRTEATAGLDVSRANVVIDSLEQFDADLLSGSAVLRGTQ